MQDSRLSKQTANNRKSRATQNRAVTEDRVSSDAVRLEEFRMMHAQAALPNIPTIPGYHVCWLTTNNPRDSLQQRIRLGYEPIKPEDVKGFDYAVGTEGATSGLIHVNEMVAFKIELGLYNLYMQDAHHHQPAFEETKLTQRVEEVQKQARAQGADVEEGDGVDALRDLDSIAVPTYDE